MVYFNHTTVVGIYQCLYELQSHIPQTGEKEGKKDGYVFKHFTRASTRKFDSAPLSAQALEDFETFITGVKPLVPEVKLTLKLWGQTA